MSQPHPPQPDRIIDARYRVVRLLGEGGFGQVFECQHVGTRRGFAVKVLLPDIARRPGVLTRFLREAQTAGSIASPNVVDVLDVGQCRDTHAAFMAMELLSGHDLAKQIEDHGVLTADLAARVAAQALSGLVAAHGRGIVHRDIKPPNLFLARDKNGERTVKVLDFGIAKVLGEEDLERAKLTVTGSILGSPWYMSPEQAAGSSDIDHRTDIWSLGAVLYEALSGVTPYHGVTSLQQLLRRICDAPPLPLSERAPHVPAAMAAVVAKAMAHHPADRYQSASEMLEAVARLVAGSEKITDTMLGIQEAPAPTDRSGQTPMVAVHTQRMPGVPVGPRPRGTALILGLPVRRTYVLIGAALLASVTLAALTLILIPKPRTQTDSPPDATPTPPSTAALATPSPTEPPSTAEADAGTPEDASADSGREPPPAPGKPPTKRPLPATGGKPGGFTPGQKGI